MLDVSADRGTFTRCIRLVIADKQPIVLQGLKSVFAAQRDFEVIASCSTAASCLQSIRNLAPDVALLANTLPDVTPFEILAIAKAEHLPTRLVFFTESEGDDDLSAAIAAGACSAISRYATPDIMLRSLRLITEHISASPERSQNLSPNGQAIDAAKIEKLLGLLTERESQIVRLVSEGLSNKEIARQLNISGGTVKVHLHNIFQKLEISNRTVLATIALLQRPAGFGTLALAALAFAILDDVKASETSNAFLDDGSTAYGDLEHPAFDVWKKAILRHTVAVDHSETVVRPQGGATSKISQATTSTARREELHAAEQAVLSSTARGHGPIGSSTPCLLISPLLQAINNSQTDNPTAQPSSPLPALAPNPLKNHAGYGAFTMTTAGAWIYALDHANAAVQVPDPRETLIDTSAVAAMDRTTHVAAITIHGASDAGSNDVDNPAPGTIAAPHPPLAFGALGHKSVPGEEKASQLIHGAAGDDPLSGAGLAGVIHGGSGNDTIKGNGGDDAISAASATGNGGTGNDTATGGHGGDQLAGRNGDGALVYLSAKDSNSTNFDTIADFTSGGDKINLAALGALAFLHLTSTSTSVPPHTLAWIYNPTTNETIVYVNPTDHRLDIGDSALLEIHLQGVVSVAESDFVYEPHAAAVTAALAGIDPALLLEATARDGTDPTTGSTDAFNEAEARESTRETGHIWTISADDGFRFHFARERIGSNVSTKLTSFGDDSPYATEASNDGAVNASAYPSSIAPAQSHASVPMEEHPTHKNEPAHANAGTAAIEHGKANVAAGPQSFEFAMPGAPILTPVVAPPPEPDTAPGNSAGHGNSQHAPNSAKASADESAEPGTPGHGNSEPPPHSAGSSKIKDVEPPEPDTAPGNSAGHGNSQHTSNSANASADESAEPAVTPGHGNSEHPSHSAGASKIKDVEPAETGASPGDSADHGNSQHASNSAKASADESAEPGTPGHGNSDHPSHSAGASKIKDVEPAETGASSGNSADHGNSKHASNSAVASADEPTEPAVTPEHSKPELPSHSAAANNVEAPEPAETSVASDNSADQSNSQHPSRSVVANASAAAPPAESVSGAEGAGHEQAFHFNNQTTPAPTISTVELEQPHDLPAPLDHITEVAAILEAGPAAMEEHAAGHGNSNQHQLAGHGSHDLLI
ncbi:LuxR C-terminal-related transcriptional regulator [Bradyrhizobium sp. BWA-3-5]|uniref:LuxR C-terminal-related transcriptional regulator n=1 Tax=Bradyrhizobium sp. BWA-3-5 TaxID=3080013 RepID=UPI00293EB390|nr:LuxR C-terminal-related transcriptional regulator [Bradyrhizobium sp. BWA-3-5]WOH66683.1 LuxR C-terminal-related transcriptional regulator [Bradyrhizobium sp. BWA-3-5]